MILPDSQKSSEAEARTYAMTLLESRTSSEVDGASMTAMWSLLATSRAAISFAPPRSTTPIAPASARTEERDVAPRSET